MFSIPTPSAVSSVLKAPGPAQRGSDAPPATSWMVFVTLMIRPPVSPVPPVPHHHRTLRSVWTALMNIITTPTLTRRGVRCVREVREPRRIISAVTRLTDSGGLGHPGVSAPSPVFGRADILILGRDIGGVSALHLNTEGWSVRRISMKRVKTVQEKGSFYLTVP